jgi:hypothetical protein
MAAPSNTSLLVAAASIAGGVLGIIKFWNDSQDAKMIAKVELWNAKLACAREIEQLNEDWDKRTGK